MGGDIPKQFLPIGGKPILMRTLERFRAYSPTLQIILVLPKDQQDYWIQLCEEYHFPLPSSGEVGRGLYQMTDGGETRFHSVQHGLALIPDDAEGVVGVHDGVRPFPSIDVIRNCYETAREKKAVIPVIPVVETLRVFCEERRIENGEFSTDAESALPSRAVANSKLYTLNSKLSKTVPRNDYRLVQTPQTFDIQLLKAANRQPYNDNFTDDASVVESYGYDITLVEGNRENIKITTPYDLKIAEVLVHNEL